MSIDDERSLADVAPEATSPAPSIIDATPDVAAQDFDFEDFLAGARPTRRAAKLYKRADLIGGLEELAQTLEANGKDPGADPKFRAMYDAFHASGRWFTVEKKSGEWEAKFRKDTARRLDIKLAKDGAFASEEDGLALAFEQAAAQIVNPANVTAEGLRKLYEINQGEVNKIFLAVRLANQEMAETVRVVGPDFSPKPSTSRDTADS